MDLECEFVDLEWYSETKYSADVTETSITEPGTELKSLKGEKDDTKEVDALGFYSTIVYYIPRGIIKLIPKLTTLRIVECNLVSVTRKDFQGLELLECLDLSRNQLTALPNDLLVGMRKLRWIYFNFNCIEVVSSKLLEPIKDNDLEYVDFTINTNINEFYSKNSHSNTLKALMEAIDENCAPKADDLLKRKLREFYATGKFSDFILKVRGKKYKVHKCILAAQSSIFDEMFSSDGDQVAKTLKTFSNVKEKVFDDFISFFYTGTVRSEANVLELLKLSVEFDVPQLQAICMKY